ncbi:MAG: DNA mismatch repair protein MutS [Planctomycetaceae bacterium]
MATTPMMQQYEDAKAACGDAILLFRMGDFYELFHEDAKTASRVLGLTLTSRDKSENPIPMAGFPYHQLEGYLARLIQAGFRAAVCEQVEDPKKAQGLVKREVTRVVTAGTLTEEALLDPRQSNYLAAVALPLATKTSSKSFLEEDSAATPPPEFLGLAWAELSTGRFYAAKIPYRAFADELARIGPVELLIAEGAMRTGPFSPQLQVTKRPDWSFGIDAALATLKKHFEVNTLEGFGFFEEDLPALRAAGALIDYLKETQKTSLAHLDRLIPYRNGDLLEIDEATRRSLELHRTIRSGSREGSLLAVMDRTVTPMGSRQLADWMANPLTNPAEIERRLDAVGQLLSTPHERDALRDELRGVYDLERLLARVITGRASPRDLCFIARTLASLPATKQRLGKVASRPLATSRRQLSEELGVAGAEEEIASLSLLAELHECLDECPELQALLCSALEEDCPLQSRDGGIIRGGYSAEIDRLRELAAGGKQWIARYQAQEAQRTGISNLKVAYNKVFGYYIEITNAQKDKTPADYIRKQTLAGAERYITPELKQYEEQVLTADERCKEMEYELFLVLRQAVEKQARRLQQTAATLARIDVLMSFAELASQRNYCRPAIATSSVLQIRDGRHPVLDQITPEGTFVPNDTLLGPDDGMVQLITGPNMAGKSTYIRQVALLTLMAQMGSYLPAREAVVGIADRIFARVGASDELSRGQSTFMVEMTETARILNTATARSLVILDEIGRGTSTYDGLSLAWAITEHLHDVIRCRALFATHYHELTDLAQTLPAVRNLNVAVREWKDDVIFLHKIIAGAADKSYGIHVARLAGVPKEVNERAKQVLSRLEAEHATEDGRPKIGLQGKKKRKGDLQLTLFAPEEHPLLDELRQLDTSRLTPLAALELLHQIQSRLAPDRKPLPK